MFDELLGLPAHPLLVHAAVVFGPLLVATALGYALVPPLRKWLGWVVVLLAVAAPAALLFAKLSGDAFRARIATHGTAEQMAPLLAQIDEHRAFGTRAVWFGAALGVLALLLVFVCTAAARRPASTGSQIISYVLIAATAVAAGVTAYYVFKTGDSGARIVWQGA
jgi:hypothetical protein